jgi:hypothetical protein
MTPLHQFHGLVDQLASIPQTDVVAARRAIGKLAWQLQYSLVPDSLAVDARWQPPHPDAVDTILTHLLDMGLY